MSHPSLHSCIRIGRHVREGDDLWRENGENIRYVVRIVILLWDRARTNMIDQFAQHNRVTEIFANILLYRLYSSLKTFLVFVTTQLETVP